MCITKQAFRLDGNGILVTWPITTNILYIPWLLGSILARDTWKGEILNFVMRWNCNLRKIKINLCWKDVYLYN